MKRIMIVVDGSANDAESLTSARNLALSSGAQLTVAHARIPHHTIMGVGEMAFVGSEGARPDEDQKRAEAAFNEVCGDLPDARFLVYEARSDAIIASLGSAHDLILVERLSAEEGPEADQLNTALFDTGRPVLLIPPMAHGVSAERIAIAWNGTTQNSRAIKSALPLMRTAKDVVLLQGSGAGAIDMAPMLEYLAAHDLAAKVVAYDSERLTARARGRALIAAACEVDATLLVTGAFGEGRRGVLAGLGRATRKIVTAAPFSVLLQS